VLQRERGEGRSEYRCIVNQTETERKQAKNGIVSNWQSTEKNKMRGGAQPSLSIASLPLPSDDFRRWPLAMVQVATATADKLQACRP